MKITKQCSECGGREIYVRNWRLEGVLGGLLPDVTGMFKADPKVEIYVCGQCGHYQLFLGPDTVAKIKEEFEYKLYK
jgi:hypothetical protein